MNTDFGYHEPYCYLMSANSMVAVYKANSAISKHTNQMIIRGSMLAYDWRSLSIATDKGIVFG